MLTTFNKGFLALILWCFFETWLASAENNARSASTANGMDRNIVHFEGRSRLKTLTNKEDANAQEIAPKARSANLMDRNHNSLFIGKRRRKSIETAENPIFITSTPQTVASVTLNNGEKQVVAIVVDTTQWLSLGIDVTVGELKVVISGSATVDTGLTYDISAVHINNSVIPPSYSGTANVMFLHIEGRSSGGNTGRIGAALGQQIVYQDKDTTASSDTTIYILIGAAVLFVVALIILIVYFYNTNRCCFGKNKSQPSVSIYNNTWDEKLKDLEEQSGISNADRPPNDQDSATPERILELFIPAKVIDTNASTIQMDEIAAAPVNKEKDLIFGFDATFDKNFPTSAMPNTPNRGGYYYSPPKGCQRKGLKVLGKYEDHKWLGYDGWPVAYVGIKTENIMEIIENGEDIFQYIRDRSENGDKWITCTEKPEVATNWALDFPNPDKNNFRNVKRILQLRVRPPKDDQIKSDNVAGQCWVYQNFDDVRPYGVCVFEM